MNSDSFILTQTSSDCQVEYPVELLNKLGLNKAEGAINCYHAIYPNIAGLLGKKELIDLFNQTIKQHPINKHNPPVLLQVNLNQLSTKENSKPDAGAKYHNAYWGFDALGLPVASQRDGTYLIGGGWNVAIVSLSACQELVKTGFGTKPGVKIGGNALSNFVAAQLIYIDVDGHYTKTKDGKKILVEPADPKRFKRLFEQLGWEWLQIYVSPSYTPKVPKFRVVLMLPEIVVDADYASAIYRWVYRQMNLVDPGILNYVDQLTDITRFFYGSIHPDLCLFNPNVKPIQYPKLEIEREAKLERVRRDPIDTGKLAETATGKLLSHIYQICEKQSEGDYTKFWNLLFDLSIWGIDFDFNWGSADSKGKWRTRNPYSASNSSGSSFSAIDGNNNFPPQIMDGHDRAHPNQYKWHSILYLWRCAKDSPQLPLIHNEYRVKDLYEVYVDFCKHHGEKPLEMPSVSPHIYTYLKGLDLKPDWQIDGFIDYKEVIKFNREQRRSANKKLTTILNGRMGIGKTSVWMTTRSLLREYAQVITPTNGLGLTIAAVLFASHPIKDGKGFDFMAKVIVHCAERLHKIGYPRMNTVLFIEEVEFILNQVVRGKINHTRAIWLLSRLTRQITESVEKGNPVDILQHGVSNITLRWLQLALRIDPEQLPEFINYIKADKPSNPRSLSLYEDKADWATQLADSLVKKERIIIVTTSFRQAKLLAASIVKFTENELDEQKDIFIVHGDQGLELEGIDGGRSSKPTVMEFLSNPDKFIQEHDYSVYIFTPTVATGLSIDDPTRYFNRVFGLFTQFSSALALQMLNRLRTDVDRIVYAVPSDKGVDKPAYTDPVKVKKQLIDSFDVNENIQAYSRMLYANNQESFRLYSQYFEKFKRDALDPITPIGMYVELYSLLAARENYSRKNLLSCLMDESKETGYRVEFFAKRSEEEEEFLSEADSLGGLLLGYLKDAKEAIEWKEACDIAKAQSIGDEHDIKMFLEEIKHEQRTANRDEQLILIKTRLRLDFPGIEEALSNPEFVQWLTGRGNLDKAINFWLMTSDHVAESFEKIAYRRGIADRLMQGKSAEVGQLNGYSRKIKLLKPYFLPVMRLTLPITLGRVEDVPKVEARRSQLREFEDLETDLSDEQKDENVKRVLSVEFARSKERYQIVEDEVTGRTFIRGNQNYREIMKLANQSKQDFYELFGSSWQDATPHKGIRTVARLLGIPIKRVGRNDENIFAIDAKKWLKQWEYYTIVFRGLYNRLEMLLKQEENLIEYDVNNSSRDVKMLTRAILKKNFANHKFESEEILEKYERDKPDFLKEFDEIGECESELDGDEQAVDAYHSVPCC